MILILKSQIQTRVKSREIYGGDSDTGANFTPPIVSSSWLTVIPADTGGLVFEGVVLRTLDCWDRGFEIC